MSLWQECIQAVNVCMLEAGYPLPLFLPPLDDGGHLMAFSPFDAPDGYAEALEKAVNLVGENIGWPGVTDEHP